MSIGKRLLEERERLHLKQDQVYEYANTSRQTLGAYENDRSKPKAEFLKSIAALGFDVGYIITGVRAENVAHTPTEMGYLRHCRLLATKKLERKGLEGLVFLRESSGIKIEDMPTYYQSATEAANDSNHLKVAEPSATTYKQEPNNEDKKK